MTNEAVEAGDRRRGRCRVLAEGEAHFAWVMDMDCGVGSLTASGWRLLGYGGDDAGRRPGTLVTPGSLSLCREALREMLQHDRGHPGGPSRDWALEMEFIRRDGSVLPVEATASLMRGQDGHPCGVVCVARGGPLPGEEEGPLRSEEDLKRSESRLRLLTQRMLEIQETERARFARDLHDELGQELVFLKMLARSLAMSLDGVPQLQEKAVEISGMAERLKTTSSRIAASIGPGILDGLGLVRAVEWCAEDFERRTGISCPVDTPAGDIGVPRSAASAAYRILQEALTNVWRHAGASQVEVKLVREGDWVALTVADDGVGISTGLLSRKSTLGFLGMHERARLAGGTLKVASGSGRGTRIVVRLPLTDAPAGPRPQSAGAWL